MLARTDDDLKIFAKIDQERQERLRASWRAQGHKTDPPRLMTIDEVPPSWLEKAVPIEVRQQQEFDSHGRGQRKQSVRPGRRIPCRLRPIAPADARPPCDHLSAQRLVHRTQRRAVPQSHGSGACPACASRCVRPSSLRLGGCVPSHRHTNHPGRSTRVPGEAAAAQGEEAAQARGEGCKGSGSGDGSGRQPCRGRDPSPSPRQGTVPDARVMSVRRG